MPPKKASIGRSTSKARKRKASLQSETDEQSEAKLESDRIRNAETLSSESVEREKRLKTDRVRTAQARNSDTVQRIRNARVRHTPHVDLNLGAFYYNANIDYCLHSTAIIGKMDKTCGYCGALKFKNETPGMCCAGGKVKLPKLRKPLEPLSTLVSGNASQSKHLLANILKYNSCVLDHFFHCQMQITNFCRFISWATLINKLTNDDDLIGTPNEALSLHYKHSSIKTTNWLHPRVHQ